MTKKRKAAPPPVPAQRAEIKPGSYLSTQAGFFEVVGGLGDLVIVRPRSRAWTLLKMECKSAAARALRLFR